MTLSFCKKKSLALMYMAGFLLFVACGSSSTGDTTNLAAELNSITATTDSITTDVLIGENTSRVTITWSGGTNSGSKEITEAQSVSMDPLSPSTLYEIVLKSYDSAGNCIASTTSFVRTPASGSTSFITISGPEDLKIIGNNLEGNYLITSDLDLDSAALTPVGSTSEPFKGIINGNGYTISNASLTGSSGYYGIIGYGENGAIGSLILKDCSIAVSSEDDFHAGTLAGFLNKNFTVSGCSSSGTANITLKGDNYGYGSNLIARAEESTIKNCSSSGTLTIENSSSGLLFSGNIVGWAFKCTITGCSSAGVLNVTSSGTESIIYAAHIAGTAYSCTISGCNSSGSVKGTYSGSEGFQCIATIVGHMNDGTLEGCHSSGTIEDSCSGSNNRFYRGIIAGNLDNCNITDCYTSGKITTTSSAGKENRFDIGSFAGVVSINSLDHSISNCFATSDAAVTIIGKSGDSSDNGFFTGGMFGYINVSWGTQLIKKCYSAAVIYLDISENDANSYAGGFTAYLTASRDSGQSTIENCHAQGALTAVMSGSDQSVYCGGFNGYHSSLYEAKSIVNNCYSACTISVTDSGSDNRIKYGGIDAYQDSFSSGTFAVTNSFYDTALTGYVSGWTEAGTGKTTTEMKALATFTDVGTDGLDTAWDFATGVVNDDAGTDDIWSIDASINNGYPYLTELESTY